MITAQSYEHTSFMAKLHLVRFVVDVLHNTLYNKSTTNRRSGVTLNRTTNMIRLSVSSEARDTKPSGTKP